MNAEHKYSRLHEAVDWFAEQMKAKLREKADDGWTGWEDAEYIEGVPCDGSSNLEQIQKHVARLCDGQPQEVDIANLVMFRGFFRHTNSAQAAAIDAVQAEKGDSDER